MFTTGRIVFTVLFIVGFVGIMIWSYRKDLKINRKHFPGAYRILIGILLIFIALFFLVKFKHLIMK